MELRFNVNGKERKPLVEALSEILGQKAEYLGAPTYGYNIGEYHIDREGTVTGEYNLGLTVALAERGFETEKSETFHLITPRGTLLIRERFDTAAQAEQAGYGMYFTHKERDIYTKPSGEGENSVTFAMVGEMFEAIDIPEAEEPETTETTETNRLSLEYPLDGFTPEKLDNLQRLVESKDVLIKEALGINELPIQILTDRITFTWFSPDIGSDSINAYSQFICALCDTAKKKSRVVAKAQESFENPRFTMRVWLIGLGLVGKEYDLCRKLMMRGLEGNSGFRYGKPEDGAAPRRDGIHREVISIRLTLDVLGKLTLLASNAETETGQRTSRNMLIEQAVEAYIREAVNILETVEPAAEPEVETTERTEFSPEGGADE